MMKLSTKVKSLTAGLVIALTTALLGTATTSAASPASCLYQYNANGFVTSATPVFNSICGVNEGIGNEPNFVRIRQSSNGVVTDNQNNPNFNVGTLTAACNSGDKFDLWNYVHNDATQNDNPDVGSGSAVAHNTAINMTAPLGQTSNTFNFGATISASNATSVTDSAGLNCGSNQVELTLVPGSVHIFSQPYGTNWQNLPDGSINSNLPLGSTNAGLSSMGNGDVWGCWTYRVVIVYQVQVKTIPTQTPPVCNSIAANDQAEVQSIKYTANSANVTGFSIDLFGGTSTSGTPISSSGNIGLNSLPFMFNSNLLHPGQQYTIVATVLSNLGNVTSKNCQFTFSTPTTPPPSTPVTPTSTTTTLPNTGPGTAGMVGVFAGVSAAGTALYNRVIKRRLTK